MQTEKLLLEKYYINKLSLFLQSDKALVNRIKDAVSFLHSVNSTIDVLEFALGAITSGLFNDGTVVNNYEYDDLLDKIAACFNVSRSFTISFETAEDEAKFNTFNENLSSSSQLPTTLNLTNDQLRLLLLCKIANNSYTGSSKELNDVYFAFVNKLKPTTISDTWKIVAITDQESLIGGICKLYFLYGSYDFSDEIVNQYFSMFFANMLTISSVGIYYDKNVAAFNDLLIFDKDTVGHGWDVGRWL